MTLNIRDVKKQNIINVKARHKLLMTMKDIALPSVRMVIILLFICVSLCVCVRGWHCNLARWLYVCNPLCHCCFSKRLCCFVTVLAISRHQLTSRYTFEILKVCGDTFDALKLLFSHDTYSRKKRFNNEFAFFRFFISFFVFLFSRCNLVHPFFLCKGRGLIKIVFTRSISITSVSSHCYT